MTAAPRPAGRPGRKPGSRNRDPLQPLLRRLAKAEGAAVLEALAARAKAGDMDAAGLLVAAWTRVGAPEPRR